MRLRDKWFPENTYRRYYLRKFNNILHGRFYVLKEKNYIRASRPRLIDRWFPEGTLIRKILRKLLKIQDSNIMYKIWIKQNEPTKEELHKQKTEKFKNNPKISILVPLYNTPIKMFKELIKGLKAQTYGNWELCLAEGNKVSNKKIQKIIKTDSRIKYKLIGENKNIAGNTNECLTLATGDFIALLDQDDLLPVFSLYEIVKCINENPTVDFIYTDEDKIVGKKKTRKYPYFKPDFSPDTLRANNYITHFSVFKKEIMNQLVGERDKYNGAQDYDLILRMTEITTNIVHIPKILYHWRMHKNSTAKKTDAKPYAYEAGRKAIEDHIERIGRKGKVYFGETPGTYQVCYDIIGTPKVSILIPNKDEIDILKRCIDSIKKITTYQNYEIVIIENNSAKKETFSFYKSLKEDKKIQVLYYPEKEFNYSKIINYGVKKCDGEYIVQLNNDTELITPEWIEKMLGFAQYDNVGAVGGRLYYPNYTIQHAGVIVGIGDCAGHVFKGLKKEQYGYFAKERLIQNLSAVTGALLFSKREIYEEVGYMSEILPVAFNDIDFCLKIRKKKKLIVYNPFVEFIHHESQTRGYEDTEEKIKRFEKEKNIFKKSWREILREGDPYYNKNLSLNSSNYAIKINNIGK